MVYFGVDVHNFHVNTIVGAIVKRISMENVWSLCWCIWFSLLCCQHFHNVDFSFVVVKSRSMQQTNKCISDRLYIKAQNNYSNFAITMFYQTNTMHYKEDNETKSELVKLYNILWAFWYIKSSILSISIMFPHHLMLYNLFINKNIWKL